MKLASDKFQILHFNCVLGYIPDHIYNFILNYIDETVVEV